MLLRVIFEHFLSFDKSQQFDMFANTKRTTFLNHIYNLNSLPTLKMAAIYGANGAGKSNIVKGMKFLKNFVMDRDYIAKIDLSSFIFKLKENAMQIPMSLIVEFVNEGKQFIYEISISLEKIEKEALYLSQKKASPTAIFIRNGNEVQIADNWMPEVKRAVESMLKMPKNRFSSLLALNNEFPILNNDDVRIAYNWFENNLIVIDINTRIPFLLELLNDNSALLSFVNDMFSKIDIGINKLSINEDDYENWVRQHASIINDMPSNAFDIVREKGGLSKFGEGMRQIMTITEDNGIKKVYQFIFEQLGRDGFLGEMEITSQSDGTVRLLTLIPALYDALNSDTTVLVDEIDNSIHPILIMRLIKFFADSDNSLGQLIFTTHETSILNQQSIMRPDEVWFVKKEEGQSILYSLNEFKIHNTMVVENGYLQGRFDGIPHIKVLA